MKVINKGLISLDQIQAPEILYKYRNFENPFHMRLLAHGELYFAAPTSFEDKLDCKTPVRYDKLTDEDILNKYLTESKVTNPHFNDMQHLEWALGWAAEGLMKDKQRLIEMTELTFNEYNDRIGILSLTANNKSLEMWNKYSTDRKGFCVGFNTKQLFAHLGGGGPVDYNYDEPPIIWPRPKHSFDEQRQLQVFTKLRKWEFEAEYRTLIFDKDKLDDLKRTKVIPVGVFNEVILGEAISKKNEEEVVEALTNRFGALKIRRQITSNGNAEIV